MQGRESELVFLLVITISASDQSCYLTHSAENVSEIGLPLLKTRHWRFLRCCYYLV